MTGNRTQRPELQSVAYSWRAFWRFRFIVVAVAYLTTALCAWLCHSTTSPLVQAIPVAAGLVLGFLFFELNKIRIEQ